MTTPFDFVGDLVYPTHDAQRDEARIKARQARIQQGLAVWDALAPPSPATALQNPHTGIDVRTRWVGEQQQSRG